MGSELRWFALGVCLSNLVYLYTLCAWACEYAGHFIANDKDNWIWIFAAVVFTAACACITVKLLERVKEMQNGNAETLRQDMAERQRLKKRRMVYVLANMRWMINPIARHSVRDLPVIQATTLYNVSMIERLKNALLDDSDELAEWSYSDDRAEWFE